MASSCRLAGLCLLAAWSAFPQGGAAQVEPGGFSAYHPPAERADADGPMSWLSLSVRVGYAYVSSGSLRNPAYSETVADTLERLSAFAADGALSAEELASLPPIVRGRFPPDLSAEALSTILDRIRQGRTNGACTAIVRVCTTPERHGLYLGFAFHVGGDGFGWDAEPYFVIGPSTFAAGLYTGPKLDFELAKRLYFGFGLGGKLAYVSAESWRYGADVYGRVPMHVTYYHGAHVALELEGSFAMGLSGYATDPKNYLIMSAPEFRFGSGYSWDLSLGVRF